MKTFNNKPIFLLNVDDEDSTITTISLVEDPAMELPMFCFEKEKEHLRFSLEDEVKHNIITCIVRTNYPILRMTEDGNPYYVVFNKETSEKLCQKLMRDGYQQNISLDHNGQLIDGIKLQEVFLKDSVKGISPVGFEDADEGSLFGVYHIEDEALWNDCVSGKFGGVSLESYFRLERFNTNKKTNNMMSKIKEMLKTVLMEFNNISTDKAELYWEEDSELAVGYKVYVNDQDGNKVPAPDGEYISDTNKIKVEGGVVSEIEKGDEVKPEDPAEPKPGEIKEEGMACGGKEKMEDEPAPAEPAVEPEPEKKEEEDNKEDKIAELESKIAELEAKIEELVGKIAELAATPAAAPVMEEFEQVTKTKTTGNKNLDKRLALAKAVLEN